jgi:hypothetical protein
VTAKSSTRFSETAHSVPVFACSVRLPQSIVA